jgi:hypothetical protein
MTQHCVPSEHCPKANWRTLVQVHTCILTLANAVWDGQPVPGDRHIASAGRRKAARCAAAEVMLDRDTGFCDAIPLLLGFS